MIPTITMTGLDERTDLDFMSRMVGHFQHPTAPSMIELAILRSPKAGQSPRYPTEETVQKIVNTIDPNHLAYHLCGGYARMVHALEWAELGRRVDFSRVRRVQVNSTECNERAMITLLQFSAFISKPVIMQWRQDVFPCVPGLSLLQDRSGGRGVAEATWSTPDALCSTSVTTRIGYAGGLNLENLRDALPRIQTASCGKRFWIDCESGLRTDDWFDIEKAEAFARTVMEVCS
jgi:phosphoribosylanthranilate isomerase